jgi:NAD(P)-dependent dehydrogenase (short-subunit alcohol dehydrogenase family)
MDRTHTGASALAFEGRVAIITGAGSGIGRHHALDFARRGARVVVNDIGGAVDGTGSDASAAELVVQEITDAGGEAVASFDSVTTPDGGAAIVQSAIDSFGRVDIVVNNAGILRDASFAKLTTDQLDSVLDVHLRGAFHVTGPAWSIMREQGYGRIVHTTSGSGLFGNFGQANYAAAKMGLVGLMRVLAIEGAKSDIKVNAIAPIARTRMTEAYISEDAGMAPDQITPAVVYLCHESCAVSGHIYHVGGGKISRVFIAVTDGIEDANLSAETIASSIETIDDTSRFTVR